jgi:membrane peptidoglycan carboxypeptidase
MASASLLAYRDGLSTLNQRRHIVKEYLNQLPLAATANHGEVNGLGDGLRAWYGSTFEDVNDVLTAVPADSAITRDKRMRRGAAYRQVLSLLLSTRSPTRYLVREDGPAALAALTDHYLPLLAEAGIIDEALCRAALKADVKVLPRAPDRPVASYVTQKAANSVRIDLLRNLGVTNLPALDRLDLTVETTFDRDVQQAVADVLNDLEDPAFLRQHGLLPLIGEADPSDIHYSVVLFEGRPDANVLRLQADNVDGPFDVNQGSKLELGSTAKVRVLITYLELVERLYRAHAHQPAGALANLVVAEGDSITQWTINHLIDHPEASLRAVLDAAVERPVSGDPTERFFTGGGLHVFQNFKPESNRTMTIREAAQESANLVFVRLMRDVLHYHIARLPGQVYAMLEDPTNDRRVDYLERFALHEGTLFLNRYLRAYRDAAARGHVLDVLGRRHDLPARQLAWAYRSVFPPGSREAFDHYLRTYAADADELTPRLVGRLYLETNPSGRSWHDLGHLAGVHPLELWLVGHLYTHPAAGYAEVLSASREVRRDVYGWLFENSKRSQDPRIRTILEQEAFSEIHKMWARLGYPFGRLVPTLATALGSSADRPAALAELMGILIRDGRRYPTVKVDSLHFAADTPYHTSLGRTVPRPTQVLSPELSAVVRGVLRDVVERGTAIRARGALPGPSGAPLVLGGKTGTGDNRVHGVGPAGRPTSVATSRTSTFAFYAGDRFFGTIVAYVDGPTADDHEFTSSLTTGILKVIGPKLAPLLHEGPAAGASGRAARTLSPAVGIGR